MLFSSFSRYSTLSSFSTVIIRKKLDSFRGYWRLYCQLQHCTVNIWLVILLFFPSEEKNTSECLVRNCGCTVSTLTSKRTDNDLTQLQIISKEVEQKRSRRSKSSRQCYYVISFKRSGTSPGKKKKRRKFPVASVKQIWLISSSYLVSARSHLFFSHCQIQIFFSRAIFQNKLDW